MLAWIALTMPNIACMLSGMFFAEVVLGKVN